MKNNNSALEKGVLYAMLEGKDKAILLFYIDNSTDTNTDCYTIHTVASLIGEFNGPMELLYYESKNISFTFRHALDKDLYELFLNWEESAYPLKVWLDELSSTFRNLSISEKHRLCYLTGIISKYTVR
jgi:hypothetical protein